MADFAYEIVDVFTERAFGGNPLAVFPDGRGLASGVMQAIARELNLSETTFVLPPEDAECDFRVRIFTPAEELPMAGHPTLGTAFVLARAGRIPLAGGRGATRFREGVGVLRVELEPAAGGLTQVTMQQPDPVFGEPWPERRAIAEAVAADETALAPERPVQSVSCGVPFLIVPVRDLAALACLAPRADLWEARLRPTGAVNFLAFTTETGSAAAARCRMFAPALGVPEDPATGSAAGPLASYLAHHGLAGRADGPEVAFVFEQGYEMGRPSRLLARVARAGDRITHVRVSGTCVAMGTGRLSL